MLSPFTVDTTRETGYAASSTLSGTRLGESEDECEDGIVTESPPESVRLRNPRRT